MILKINNWYCKENKSFVLQIWYWRSSIISAKYCLGVILLSSLEQMFSYNLFSQVMIIFFKYLMIWNSVYKLMFERPSNLCRPSLRLWRGNKSLLIKQLKKKIRTKKLSFMNLLFPWKKTFTCIFRVCLFIHITKRFVLFCYYIFRLFFPSRSILLIVSGARKYLYMRNSHLHGKAILKLFLEQNIQACFILIRIRGYIIS
jgi:hypothetical protein